MASPLRPTEYSTPLGFLQLLPNGTTITPLTGPVLDQAGRRGILNKLWDLNLTLLTVTRTDP